MTLNHGTTHQWAVKELNINLGIQEIEKLDKYCQQTGRPATDVIRELIRSLPAQEDATANT